MQLTCTTQHGLKIIENDLGTHADNLIKILIYLFQFQYEKTNSTVVSGSAQNHRLRTEASLLSDESRVADEYTAGLLKRERQSWSLSSGEPIGGSSESWRSGLGLPPTSSTWRGSENQENKTGPHIPTFWDPPLRLTQGGCWRARVFLMICVKWISVVEG